MSTSRIRAKSEAEAHPPPGISIPQLRSQTTMNEPHPNLLRRIANLLSDWHGAGTVSDSVLEFIAAETSKGGARRLSLEAAAGRTSLLFSNQFERHCVFAIDCGGSVSKVRTSSLFRPNNTVIIEGPAQLTLPVTGTSGNLDCVLIDVPHGYPFPDLENYFLYPKIRPGRLLIIDDILITSIRRMFEILSADDMWQRLKVIATTAILQLTNAPTTDLLGDELWKQGYSRAAFVRNQRLQYLKDGLVGRLLRRLLRGNRA